MEIYSKDGTLYHHGVKGMKWGVRKARKVYDRVVTAERKKNKREHSRDQLDNIFNPKGSPWDQYKRSQKLKRDYKNKDVKLAWKQAVNKAKMDPEYKKSEEYREIKKERSKVAVEEMWRDLKDAGKKT